MTECDMQILRRTISQRFRERNSGSKQEQIGSYECPGNPTSAWRAVKPSLGRRCGSYVQDYGQIFGDVHPGVPEPSKKGFIARHHV